MNGRIRALPVSTTAVEVAEACPDRTAIMFGVGAATDPTSVMVRDGEIDATASFGFPIRTGAVVRFEGQLARRRWTAIRLIATDTNVGICEEFPESYAMDKEPKVGVPT